MIIKELWASSRIIISEKRMKLGGYRSHVDGLNEQFGSDNSECCLMRSLKFMLKAERREDNGQ